MLRADDPCEFDVKIKLLMDTLRLLHFQPSDRTNSIDIERAEKEHRLCLKLGKEYPRSAHSSDEKKLNFLVRAEFSIKFSTVIFFSLKLIERSTDPQTTGRCT